MPYEPKCDHLKDFERCESEDAQLTLTDPHLFTPYRSSTRSILALGLEGPRTFIPFRGYRRIPGLY